MSQIRRLVARLRRDLWCTLLGVVMSVPPLAAQGDSAPAGPPPHFVTDSGTLIDVTKVGALQRRVSLDLSNVPIDKAILAITDQAKFWLIYRGNVVPVDRGVSIHAREITAAAALTEVLRGIGVDIAVTSDLYFALIKCTHVSSAAAGGDGGVITGRIVDRNTGAPLVGAIITVSGTPRSATANREGRYRLVGLSPGTYVVTARYIGYAPSNDTVLVGPGGTIRDFALAPSAQPLEQVVVTGTLVPTEVKALPTPITIITAEDIRRQNVMRLDELFRGQVAGAFAWDKPGEDYSSIINVRGASSFSALASVKTYIDGIEVDPQFTVLVDPNSIERIELTRGPQASTIYGSDAISGVLQIFTKKGALGLARPEGEVKTSAGLIEKNHGPGVAARLQGGVTLRGGDQQTRYQASAYYRHDGEWTPGSGSNNWNVSASAENVHGPVTSRITAMFAQKILGYPDYIALRDSGYTYFSRSLFERFNVQTQTYGASFTYAATPWWRHDLVLGYDRWAVGVTQTERRLITPDDTLFLVVRNQRSKKSIFYFTTVHAALGPTIGATFTAGFNHYALDGTHAFFPASTMNAGPLDGPSTNLAVASTNSGYFAQTQMDLAETAFLTAGLRAERNPDFGDRVGTVVSPRLGAAYVRPIGRVTLKLRASYGEGIRAPGPNQNQALTDAISRRLRNPFLRPERQHGSDAGIDLSWGSHASLSATYYRQKVVDLIDLVFDSVAGSPPLSQSQYRNVGSVRNRGWEIEARYSTERLQISGAFSLANSQILQLDSVYGGGYQIGDRLFDVPRHSIGLTAFYRLSSNTAVRMGITNVGDWIERDWIAFYGVVYANVPPRSLDRDYWITYPGFTKVRVGVEQKLWKGLTGTFDVANITNSQAFESHNLAVPPPRTFTVTLQMPY